MPRATPTAPEVEHRVADLPDDFTVRRTADRWVVIGPTGLFLIALAQDDPQALAEQTAIDAHVLRHRLAEVLDMVPFVDPVVVCDRTVSENPACAIVESRLLPTLLMSGPEVIPESELQLLRHHLPGVLTAMETTGDWG